MTELGQMLYDDGWTQGATKALIDAVLDFLKDLGTIPQQVASDIQSTTDEKQLKSWLRMAGKAESIEQFCKDAGFEK